MPIGPWSPNAKKSFSHRDVLIAVEQAKRETEIEVWARAEAQRNIEVEQARQEEREAIIDLASTMSPSRDITQLVQAIRARGNTFVKTSSNSHASGGGK